MEGLKSNPPLIRIVEPEIFHKKTASLVKQMVINISAFMQKSCEATQGNPTEFKKHIEVSLTQRQEIISKLDKRTKQVFDRIINDAYPRINDQEIVGRIKQVFNIEDPLFRKITECTNVVLIQEFVQECEKENILIVDRIISAPIVPFKKSVWSKIKAAFESIKEAFLRFFAWSKKLVSNSPVAQPAK